MMRHLPQWIVDGTDEGLRLDRFLAGAARLGSRGRAADALARGRVFVNDVEATMADAATRVATGDVIRVWADRPGSASRRAGPFRTGDLRILYEDEALLVLDKPPGMLTVPLERRPNAASAYAQVQDHFRSSGKRRPMVVHRIDLDTSGLVVFAKTARAQARLKEQFRRREPARIYLAVVYGHPQPEQGTWRDTLFWDSKALIQREARAADARSMQAVCHYRTIERFGSASLLEVRLHTGKRNQIRIQAQLHGHPLVGERRYVDEAADAQRPIRFPRQALHAFRLEFVHPDTGRPLQFEAAIPRDLRDLLARLRR